MPRQTRRVKGPTRVEQTRHAENERVNIPTVELEAFAGDDEKQPQIVLYPRNPDLDPQLVWRGKDAQDEHPLEVPSVPIYIQEHISPKALIEDLREVSAGRREQQLDLFRDFNGMDIAERVDFYRHPMKWTNRLILGDSLLVMTSLAEKEGLKGQVQMIYLDPPYGIKFGSNWQVSTRRRDVKDGKLDDATRQPEQVKAFRDTWELGIHSYLSYLRDRLVASRDLLAESGSIFVQINEANLHLVRCLLDETFGSANFVSLIAFAKSGTNDSAVIGRTHDYLLWYAKSIDRVKVRRLWLPRVERVEGGTFNWIELPDGGCRTMSKAEREDPSLLPEGSRRFRASDISSQGETSGGSEPVVLDGKTYRPSPGRHWNADTVRRAAAAGRVLARDRLLAYKRFEDDFPLMPTSHVWDDTIIGTFTEKRFVVMTGPKVLERCILMTTDPGDLVLDPTCGSGTTMLEAEEWGRRWITVDTSRVAITIARTAITSARFPYYILADSPEGLRSEAELTGQAVQIVATTGDIRKGFVCERVAHITLKSIAENPEIQEGMSRSEIEAAITRHADIEILHDRPYSDSKVVRVAGPFTVESLSPHRVALEAGDAQGTAPAQDEARFVDMVLENLRTAGVQNQLKNQRLRFGSLDRFPGQALQAEGLYEEGDTSRRAAIGIGPQYGTVGTELVREAAKEAAGWFDLLIVCGFAFDARAEELSHLGSLPIIYARMNADLLLGDQLKKTGAGNLFTVFGQPDVEVRTVADDQLQVDLRGIDVYDPTTGEIRSDSPDEIASWFIDTNYNGESFFVRHAYFCGGDRPYERLQKTLKADIDEAAWESLYSATSRPFPAPDSGKIAVKVINHYGDEILKVYEIAQ